MRSAILAGFVLGVLGCSSAPSRQKPGPSPLTRADSARITAAFLSGSTANSANYSTLREYFARRDSVEAANANPRRYRNIRVF